MAHLISFVDETSTWELGNTGTLALDSGTITLRELIRTRVYQEVAQFNESAAPAGSALVQPEEAELLLNASRGSGRRPLDPARQFDKAIGAFESNAFLVLLDDRQVCDLDEVLELGSSSRVSFLRLVPLAGG